MPFFEYITGYYYIVLILQGICVIHCIRRGTQQKWIWLIVFLPLIGCIAYLFTEVIKKRHLSSIQSNVVNVVNPSGKIKDLEKSLSFSDTFTNRVALADAYLQNAQYEKAIGLYESSLKGVFIDNEHAVKQLINAYHHVGRTEDIIKIAPRVTGTMYFSKSHINLYYAMALEKCGKPEMAEKEFVNMNHRFSNYESRFGYGQFLTRAGRKEDAAILFDEIIKEAEHLNRNEKGADRVWINKAKEEWTKLMSASV